jgi:catechol 2,3-dioxygenase-like lactoylglutathione lyase family enzyme
MFAIDRFDHLVLTVSDIDASIAFYTRVLGMGVQHFGTPEKPRVALCFGRQKINLHAVHALPDANVLRPIPGTADFCLITETPLADVLRHLAACAVHVVDGPIARTGATGPIQSVYVRDPDANLIEIANYID